MLQVLRKEHPQAKLYRRVRMRPGLSQEHNNVTGVVLRVAPATHAVACRVCGPAYNVEVEWGMRDGIRLVCYASWLYDAMLEELLDNH